jgi:4-amino-4-deoxy-L-arabinose transferase-like glycosyltransferase
MARNFHHGGYELGRPQVDWGGAGPGDVESEFPIYSYAVALAYGVFGVQESLGRLLAALVYLAGAWGLYALVRETVDRRTALWSLALFLFLPLNVYYSRAFMPEAWMISASVLGVLYFHRWTVEGKPWRLLLSGSFVALAALIKLPALYLGLPILYLAWIRFRGRLFARPELWLFAFGILASVAIWYGHAHAIVRAGGLSFGIWEYGSDKWGNWSLVGSAGFWNGIVFRSLAERWFTWIGFALLLGGLLLPRRSERERLFDWWLIAVLVYFVIVARGNFVHEYYQLPFMPAGVVFVAKVFARLTSVERSALAKATAAVAMVGIGALSAVRLGSYLGREDPARSAEAIVGDAARTRTEPKALIVTPTGGNPTLLYLAARKGWTVPEGKLTPAFLTEAEHQGARYLVGTGNVPEGLPPRTKSDSSRFVFRSRHGYVIRLGSKLATSIRER